MAFEIKQGDLSPSLGATCRDDAGAVVDISGSTVLFRFRREGEGGTVREGAANLIGGGTLGQISYDWQAGDTDEPGNYLGEFVVTIAGREKTFPSIAFLRFSINRRLS